MYRQYFYKVYSSDSLLLLSDDSFHVHIFLHCYVCEDFVPKTLFYMFSWVTSINLVAFIHHVFLRGSHLLILAQVFPLSLRTSLYAPQNQND
jgi:hypothetical protein